MKTLLQNAMTMLLAVTVSLGTGLACQAWQGESAGASSGETTSYLRLQTDEFQDPLALQTATTRFVLEGKDGEEPVEVILESVVHIADSSYYRGFQKRFERYDSVLYESVIREEESLRDRESEEEQTTGFQLLQQLSTGTLGLAYQSDEINYRAGNLRHADLTLKEISARMSERGDSQVTVFSDLVKHIFQQLGSGTRAEPAADRAADGASPGQRPQTISLDLSLFRDPDGIMKIRRAMAMALVGSGLLDSPLPPPIHGMVIGDRNTEAIKVLKEEMERGRRRIAIFYGVGHMADFEQRLTSELGMKKVSVNWRNAWDLRDGAIEGAPLEGLIEATFRDSFKSKLQNFAKGMTERKKDRRVEEQRREAEMEKDRQLEAMEKTLRALEAKLQEVEQKAAEESAEQATEESAEEASESGGESSGEGEASESGGGGEGEAAEANTEAESAEESSGGEDVEESSEEGGEEAGEQAGEENGEGGGQ